MVTTKSVCDTITENEAQGDTNKITLAWLQAECVREFRERVLAEKTQKSKLRFLPTDHLDLSLSAKWCAAPKNHIFKAFQGQRTARLNQHTNSTSAANHERAGCSKCLDCYVDALLQSGKFRLRDQTRFALSKSKLELRIRILLDCRVQDAHSSPSLLPPHTHTSRSTLAHHVVLERYQCRVRCELFSFQLAFQT